MPFSRALSLLLMLFCSNFARVEAFGVLERLQSGVRPAANDDAVLELLQAARRYGPVGHNQSEEVQQIVLKQAEQLTSSRPARAPLTGTHQLVYSAAPGTSSGKLGPFVGKVTQYFEDDVTFYNRVDLGPVRIALRATREIINDNRIRVTFRETTVSLFGQKITSKEVNGGGVWECLYVGQCVTPSGEKKLVRVMKTPSLFVLESALEK